MVDDNGKILMGVIYFVGSQILLEDWKKDVCRYKCRRTISSLIHGMGVPFGKGRDTPTQTKDGIYNSMTPNRK